ncbi:uncharacterized protein LOC116618546 isoform X2 [Nematostella vectensis]|nr:uncharacterized protein LOC116618546 isoform X2 [Nematostella vectensis]
MSCNLEIKRQAKYNLFNKVPESEILHLTPSSHSAIWISSAGGKSDCLAVLSAGPDAWGSCVYFSGEVETLEIVTYKVFRYCNVATYDVSVESARHIPRGSAMLHVFTDKLCLSSTKMSSIKWLHEWNYKSLQQFKLIKHGIFVYNLENPSEGEVFLWCREQYAEEVYNKIVHYIVGKHVPVPNGVRPSGSYSSLSSASSTPENQIRCKINRLSSPGARFSGLSPSSLPLSFLSSSSSCSLSSEYFPELSDHESHRELISKKGFSKSCVSLLAPSSRDENAIKLVTENCVSSNRGKCVKRKKTRSRALSEPYSPDDYLLDNVINRLEIPQQKGLSSSSPCLRRSNPETKSNAEASSPMQKVVGSISSLGRPHLSNGVVARGWYSKENELKEENVLPIGSPSRGNFASIPENESIQKNNNTAPLRACNGRDRVDDSNNVPPIPARYPVPFSNRPPDLPPRPSKPQPLPTSTANRVDFHHHVVLDSPPIRENVLKSGTNHRPSKKPMEQPPWSQPLPIPTTSILDLQHHAGFDNSPIRENVQKSFAGHMQSQGPIEPSSCSQPLPIPSTNKVDLHHRVVHDNTPIRENVQNSSVCNRPSPKLMDPPSWSQCQGGDFPGTDRQSVRRPKCFVYMNLPGEHATPAAPATYVNVLSGNSIKGCYENWQKGNMTGPSITPRGTPPKLPPRRVISNKELIPDKSSRESKVTQAVTPRPPMRPPKPANLSSSKGTCEVESRRTTIQVGLFAAQPISGRVWFLRVAFMHKDAEDTTFKRVCEIEKSSGHYHRKSHCLDVTSDIRLRVQPTSDGFELLNENSLDIDLTDIEMLRKGDWFVIEFHLQQREEAKTQFTGSVSVTPRELRPGDKTRWTCKAFMGIDEVFDLKPSLDPCSHHHITNYRSRSPNSSTLIPDYNKRLQLCKALDITLNSNHRDWRQLAGALNFTINEITEIQDRAHRCCDFSPTDVVLHRWEERGRDFGMDRLVCILRDMGRLDVVQDLGYSIATPEQEEWCSDSSDCVSN